MNRLAGGSRGLDVRKLTSDLSKPENQYVAATLLIHLAGVAEIELQLKEGGA